MNIANRVPTPTRTLSHQTPPAPIISHTTTHTPEELAVVKKFKDYLLSSLCANPDAENLINCAIKGVLDPSTTTPTHDGEDPQVIGIRKVLQDMLDNLRAKTKEGSEAVFAQILESVGVSNEDGVLPLPVPSKSPSVPPRTEAPPESDAGPSPQARETANGNVGGQGNGGNETTTPSSSSSPPAPVEERNSLKRPLDEDVDGSPMDARLQGAKRIAT